MKLTDDDVLTAVRNENRTNKEIASALNISEGHAQRVTKELTESGVLQREKVGRSMHYFEADSDDSDDSDETTETAEPQNSMNEPANAHPNAHNGQHNGQHNAEHPPEHAPQYAPPQQYGAPQYPPHYAPQNAHAYAPPQPPAQPTPGTADSEGMASAIREGFAEAVATMNGAPADDEVATTWPVNRNYNWNEYLLDPESVDEYLQTNDEYDRVHLQATDPDVAYRTTLYGPSGCGKTALARYLAASEGYLFFEVQARLGLRESELLGKGMIAGAGRGTVWSDGVLPKALLASLDPEEAYERYGVQGWDGKVVLLIDEINRARPEEKAALFPALDHRCQVELHGGRGGEIIRGTPENLVVIATANEGHGHRVQPQDVAERGRFGGLELDFLGYVNPSTNDDETIEAARNREAEIIADRTGAPLELVREMVDAANYVRHQAKEGNDINYGVPTRAVLRWATFAMTLGRNGVKNPVMKAAHEHVIQPYYGQPMQSNERREVLSAISSRLDGAPVDPDAYTTFADFQKIECQNDQCNFSTSYMELQKVIENDRSQSSVRRANEVLAGKCPSCGGELSHVDTESLGDLFESPGGN